MVLEGMVKETFRSKKSNKYLSYDNAISIENIE